MSYSISKIADVQVLKVGLGAMMLTWVPVPVPDEQAFAAIKSAFDMLPKSNPEVRLLINSADFYGGTGADEKRTDNLDLLSRYFEKYPEDADRCFLSVKGGIKDLVSDHSEENLRASVDNILKHLRGFKKLDLFECARADSKVPYEVTMERLVQLKNEGKFDYIGASELGAQTIRKAHAVHPLAAVEIEISPWSYEEETRQVIETTKELGIAIIAYSPLGRGFLTGTIKVEEVTDLRARFARFKSEAAAHNQKIVDALAVIASQKGINNAELCLAWVSALGSHIIPIPGSSKPERVQKNIRSSQIQLSDEEVERVKSVVTEHGVAGGRYYGGTAAQEHLWQ